MNETERLLFALGYAVLVYDSDGAELGRSGQLQEVLDGSSDPEWLLAEMLDAAVAIAGFENQARSEHSEGVQSAITRIVPATAPRFRICAGPVPDPDATSKPNVAVAVHRISLELPTARVLTEKFRLTQREAQIALLLAAGSSNREIALQLRISTHTARSHAEHIFGKLGIHSRKAMALKLVAAAEPPASTESATARAPERKR